MDPSRVDALTPLHRPIRRRLAGLLCLLLAASAAAAPAEEPAPGRAASTPGAAAVALDAAGWLHRLEALAEGRAGFDARLRYTTVQGLLEDEQVRFGRLRLAHGGAEAPDRFRIDLDGEAVDQTLRPLDRRLVWDGRRLLDADADRREASVRVFEDPAELTATLPIPMRVDADALLGRYAVTLVPASEEEAASGAAAGIHLTLADRNDPDADPLEVWFDPETGLPLRGRSGRTGGDTRTVDVVGASAVAAFDGGLFDTAPPAGDGWRIEAPADAG